MEEKSEQKYRGGAEFPVNESSSAALSEKWEFWLIYHPHRSLEPSSLKITGFYVYSDIFTQFTMTFDIL